MAVRKIIHLGNPILKKKCKIVRDVNSKVVKSLIKDLVDTMRKNNLIGIAAPQIGSNDQVFLTEARNTKSRSNIKKDKLRIFVNPRIKSESKSKVVIWEGCGCTGDMFAPLERPKTVTVEALNEKGKKFQITVNGLIGRILQHEMDHLEGIEFVQRVKDNNSFVHKDYYIKHHRNSKSNIKNSKTTKLEVKQF